MKATNEILKKIEELELSLKSLFNKTEYLDIELQKQEKLFSESQSSSSEGSGSDGTTDTNPPEEETPTQSTETWQTIYNCASDDETVNVGYTSGIPGTTGVIANFPDMAPYNYIKVWLSVEGLKSSHVFDITDKNTNTYALMTHNLTGTAWYTYSITLAIRDGKATLNFTNSLKIQFLSNKYPTLTSMAKNSNCIIYKIEAK